MILLITESTGSTGSSRALMIIVILAAFTAAFVISGVVTYKLRMRSLNDRVGADKADTADGEVSSEDNDNSSGSTEK
ncbi:MAG: hypothetical protein IJ874_03335 [Ruminococcus sp.]|nr:hypothetical protein [Ruminococcus sp.]